MADSTGIEKKTGTFDAGRRLLLKAAAVLVSLAWLPRAAYAFFIKGFEVRTVEKETFRFDAATGTLKWTDRKAPEPYRLIVDGLVEKPLTLSYSELLAFPRIAQTSDFHCVEGWSVKDVKWAGFRFDEVVKRARPKAAARYVVFHALGNTTSQPDGVDHYLESLPLHELLDAKKQCLLALFMDGKPLTHQHGAPLRVVSPYDMGYKGTKYVARITFSAKAQPGWWTLANPMYPVDAPIPSYRLRKTG